MRENFARQGVGNLEAVELGSIFTQTRCDEEGRPERDFASTTYVGGFESAETFGLRVRAEAQRRGVGRARKVVFIGDGAPWIWELCRLNFPAAVEILDLYHALAACCTKHATKPGCSADRGSWRPDAAPSSASVSKTPACFGPKLAAKASWICVAPSKAIVGTNVGIACINPTALKSELSPKPVQVTFRSHTRP